ncbi:hypothetical protein BGZ82_010939 [Podila clonocystis]|nr:hypothetical protein BGZ82_010939 [Podila clonocystis]
MMWTKTDGDGDEEEVEDEQHDDPVKGKVEIQADAGKVAGGADDDHQGATFRWGCCPTSFDALFLNTPHTQTRLLYLCQCIKSLQHSNPHSIIDNEGH